jgi:hypothetical protein
MQAMAKDMAETLQHELLAKLGVDVSDARALDLARNAIQAIAGRIEDHIVSELANRAEEYEDSNRTLGLNYGVQR